MRIFPTKTDDKNNGGFLDALVKNPLRAIFTVMAIFLATSCYAIFLIFLLHSYMAWRSTFHSDSFSMLIYFFILVLRSLVLSVGVILAVALFTLTERKILSSIQLRLGPNTTGPFGALQPFADAIKLLSKETVVPSRSNRFIFLVTPVFSFFISLASWAVIPLSTSGPLVSMENGLLYLVALSSLNVFVLLLAGWSSNSRYAFLGSMRTAAQLISYELSLIAVLMCPAALSQSFDLEQIAFCQTFHGWYIFPLHIPFLLYLVLMLAETNRAPFDLPEAESELVSGYNTEYSSASFALFFLAEYSNILLLSSLGVTIFLGGPYLPFFDFHFSKLFSQHFGPAIFSIKLSFFIFVFVWIRGSLPRYRYDQLMVIGWKVLLPLSLSALLISLVLVRLGVG